MHIFEIVVSGAKEPLRGQRWFAVVVLELLAVGDAGRRITRGSVGRAGGRRRAGRSPGARGYGGVEFGSAMQNSVRSALLVDLIT